MDTMSTELEKQDGIEDAIRSIYRARAILECVHMACAGMASDIGVPLDNTLEVADDLLDEAMASLRQYQRARGVMN